MKENYQKLLEILKESVKKSLKKGKKIFQFLVDLIHRLSCLASDALNEKVDSYSVPMMIKNMMKDLKYRI